MEILVSVGRFLVGLAAILVIIVAVVAGGIASSQANMGFVIGGAVGGSVGLIVAGSLFGAIAALFQIAGNTARTMRAVEKLAGDATRT